MKLIFAGTPEFAAQSLFALIAAGLLLVSGQGPRLAEGMRIWLALLTPQAHIRFR